MFVEHGGKEHLAPWPCPLTVAGTLFGAYAIAHSGGTDSAGCHTDRKTGVYHCH